MMTKIYSAAAAAAAVDDYRRLFVRLSIPNSDRYDYDQYLCEISPKTFSKYEGNMYFPSIESDCLGGCCGGLLYLYHGKGKTVILNPIKREFKFLPPSQVKRPAGTNNSYYTACGLGFDSQSNDYKVVRFVRNYEETLFDYGINVLKRIHDSQVELYSLKTNSWKEISAPELDVQGCGIYVNTKCYWVSFSPFSVISFDFENESFSSFIPMPKTLRTLYNFKRSDDDPDIFDALDIFEYKGSLAVIGYKKLGGYTSFEAYKLKGQGQEWEKEFAVKVSGDHEPLGFGKKGRLLFLVGTRVQNKRYQLQVYDRFDQNLVALPIFADGCSRMQILPCSDDDPDANILSRVKSIVVPQDAKQFFVDERMEIDNPINHHLYRNLGSKSMASKQGSSEQGQGLNKRRAAVWNFRTTTKEETCTRALKELIAQGCMSGYGSTLKDGLKKKDPRTDLKGNPDIISISIWKRICYFQIQWLSESEVVFELVGDLKTEKDMYGKLATGGGDHVNCLSQEEEQHHPIPPKNKGKKRKSNDGV
ncbi:hypothetical protein OROGR_011931 [Orobanche gracilis]